MTEKLYFGLCRPIEGHYGSDIFVVFYFLGKYGNEYSNLDIKTWLQSTVGILQFLI
jgi:hypothetical protein